MKAVSPEIKKKIEDHPCYCAGAHLKYSRIHLPVAPACNIQCNYCNRKFDCSNESRPGVTSEVLDPADALKKVITAKHQLPNLSVTGIAGPGDALANPAETFAAFRLIQMYDPGIHLCLSTNGYALPEYVDEIHEIGIEHVTVTVNAVDPEIGALIYSNIAGKTGVEAAAHLLEKQIEGIKGLVARNILVKINSVLIPGVNDEHLKDVAAKMKELGVFIHNIIPLLSKPEYGTKFALDGVPEPNCSMLAKVRQECATAMGGSENIMSHCKQCRADAAGLLGDNKSSVPQLECDEHCGNHYEKVIDLLKKDAVETIKAELKEVALDRPLTVACASADGAMVDMGFGKSKTFEIFRFSEEGFFELGTINIDEVEMDYEGSANVTIDKVRKGLVDCDIVVYKNLPKPAMEGFAEIGMKAVKGKAYGLCVNEAWNAVKLTLERRSALDSVGTVK